MYLYNSYGVEERGGHFFSINILLLRSKKKAILQVRLKVYKVESS